MEHDLFGKPVPTFPDHALAARAGMTGSGRSTDLARCRPPIPINQSRKADISDRPLLFAIMSNFVELKDARN
jgi:hypothetical protein